VACAASVGLPWARPGFHNSQGRAGRSWQFETVSQRGLDSNSCRPKVLDRLCLQAGYVCASATGANAMNAAAKLVIASPPPSDVGDVAENNSSARADMA